MDSQTEQLYLRLQEFIKERNHEQVVRVCDQILQKKHDDKVSKCRMTALVKSEKFSVLTSEYAKKVPGSGDEEDQQLIYAYFLYCTEKYDDCLSYLSQINNSSLSFQILHSQVLNKLSRFSQSAESYLIILKKFPKADDFSDILVNAIASSISSNDKRIQENARSMTEEFVKSSRGATHSRELVYNYGTLLGCLNMSEESSEQQRKFRQLIQNDSDKQDDIMAVLQGDYSDYMNKNKVLQGEEMEKKMREYEEFLKLNLSDKNLKAVLSNNLVAFRQLHKHEQFGDSLKLLEDAIVGKCKQNQEQLLVFRLNKILVLLQRGKYAEALSVMTEIENIFEKSSLQNGGIKNLEGNIKYLMAKACLLLRAKKDDQLASFLELLQTNILKNPNADQGLRLDVFLLLAEVARMAGHSKQVLEYFGILEANTDQKSLLYENEVLCCFVLAYIAKIKEEDANGLIQPILQHIAANTQNPLILQYLGDVYSKKNTSIAIQIYSKLTQQFPKESAYHQRLAKIYSAAGDFEKAEALLQNIKFNLIDDYFELSKLESEIALSKISSKNITSTTALHKKIQKLKNKRVRYPKNFDPKNPGNPPNPERWLPKWERKDFKKKKGANLNSKTQGSAAAAQDHISTSKTFAVAHSTSHKKATENKKTNKRKNK